MTPEEAKQLKPGDKVYRVDRRFGGDYEIHADTVAKVTAKMVWFDDSERGRLVATEFRARLQFNRLGKVHGSESAAWAAKLDSLASRAARAERDLAECKAARKRAES